MMMVVNVTVLMMMTFSDDIMNAAQQYVLFCTTMILIPTDDVTVASSFEPITTHKTRFLSVKVKLGTLIFSCSCFCPCLKVTNFLLVDNEDCLVSFADVELLTISYLNKTIVEGRQFITGEADTPSAISIIVMNTRACAKTMKMCGGGAIRIRP